MHLAPSSPIRPRAEAGLEERAETVEEFRVYLGDHEWLEEARTRVLSPSDMKPVTMNVDDATLACLEGHWRVQEAVKATGHSFREILKECQLVLDGNPDYPSGWTIRWPCGFIPSRYGPSEHGHASEHGRLVRAVLFLVWPFSVGYQVWLEAGRPRHLMLMWPLSTDSCDDFRRELERRHNAAVTWTAHYGAEVNSTAQQVKLDAEHRRRVNAGSKSGLSPKRTKNLRAVKAVLRALKDFPRHEQIHIAKIRLENKGVDLSESQIRRHRKRLENAGQRKTRTN
jgi:hypothetical protein